MRPGILPCFPSCANKKHFLSNRRERHGDALLPVANVGLSWCKMGEIPIRLSRNPCWETHNYKRNHYKKRIFGILTKKEDCLRFARFGERPMSELACLKQGGYRNHRKWLASFWVPKTTPKVGNLKKENHTQTWRGPCL